MAIDNGLYSPLDEVRAIIGDSSGELITDQTLDALLIAYDNNVRVVSLKALQYIVADCAKKVDQEVGDVKVWYSQKYRQLKDLLDKLLRDPSMMLAPAVHFLGGVSNDEAYRVNTHPDSRRIAISKGEFTRTERFLFSGDHPYDLDEV